MEFEGLVESGLDFSDSYDQLYRVVVRNFGSSVARCVTADLRSRRALEVIADDEGASKSDRAETLSHWVETSTDGCQVPSTSISGLWAILVFFIGGMLLLWGSAVIAFRRMQRHAHAEAVAEPVELVSLTRSVGETSV